MHVSGKNLDPVALLKGTRLDAYRIHHVGEPCRPRDPGGAKFTSSGFSVIVSDASWSDLRQQIADACAFLDRHAEDIRSVRAPGTVDDIRLDFPIDSRLSETIAGQFDFFPAELVARAGALGIGLELSTYRTSEEQNGGPPGGSG